MATLINNAGVQHYANKMVLAENRKVGSKSLPTALNDIDLALDEMKNLFDAEYGSALDMKLENTENIFSVGTGSGVDKKADVENSFTDVELFGNSLVNLNKYSLGSFTVSESKYYTPEKSLCDLSQLKNNTDYTLIIDYDIKDGSSDRYNTCELVYADAVVHYGQNFIINNKKGVNVFKFTTRESFPIESTKLAVRFIRLGSGSPIEGEQVTADIKNVLLLEGDYTNKPIPNYFEGMKSVGEAEGNKISISSRNKNLDEGAELYGKHYSYTNGALSTANGYNSHKATVKPNTNYFLTNHHSNITFWDEKYNFIRGIATGTKITTPSNCKYVRYAVSNACEHLVQIEEGNTSTAFVSSLVDKKQISLNEPLRGLPNGVKDSIEKINGEWKIVRRCGEIILDGSQSINKPVDGSVVGAVNRMFQLNSKLDEADNHNINAICELLPSYTANYTWKTDLECISLNLNGHLQFRLSPSRFPDYSAEGCKQWLTQNPMKVIYKLKTPTIEDISPVTLQVWKNGTISIDSVIPVESTHTVALNKPAQIKRNIEELTQLRNKVKSLEEQYDQIALEQTHQLELINHSFELDYI